MGRVGGPVLKYSGSSGSFLSSCTAWSELLSGHYYTYLVMQWGPTGAAAQVQGLIGAGGYGRWDGGQGLGFRAEFWVLRRKPLIATCKGEKWFGLVEARNQ